MATCCHHRCSWRQYVNKAFFSGRGFSGEEFELLCWMTGSVRLLLSRATEKTMRIALSHTKKLHETVRLRRMGAVRPQCRA